MFISKADKLTFSPHFLEPKNANQRQYEALRAYFVEGLSSMDAAQRFGYSPGSFRGIVHRFRQDPDRDFFGATPEDLEVQQQHDERRQRIITLRKLNLSIYDIRRSLQHEGITLSAVAINQILRDEGFARLPRRLDEERPPGTKPEQADSANVELLDLSPRSFRTKFGGLFLFLPDLVPCRLDTILRRTGFPGSEMVPAGCAMRSLLALKLFGNARHSHVMSHVLDEGLALFASLNVIPKRSFLAEYSCRINPTCYPLLMKAWLKAVRRGGLEHGSSFDLDFHTIPFHGEDAILEKHYISKRSRRQKGILAFLAQDTKTRVFCYANADLRKDQQNDEVLRFIDFWKQHTGQRPDELIFDSKLTTYANLNRVNQQGIDFITLRRRTPQLLQKIAQEPLSAWRRIELEATSRAYRTPRILDQTIHLPDYNGPLRQLVVADLGHEEPTLLITNQRKRSPVQLIGRYAQRMLIENGIEDGIDFFHMDALSSSVALKVNCDVQLTILASSLYRMLANRIGNGYETAKSQHLFRDFIDATAVVTITKQAIEVRFQKRAHNPLLLAAGYDRIDLKVPWLENRPMNLVFG